MKEATASFSFLWHRSSSLSILYLPYTQNTKARSWQRVQNKTNLPQTPHHIRGVTNCSPACSAGISGVHLVLLFLYVLLHVSPVWYYLLQTASYLGAASTVFYNKPGRALNEPITRAAGRRGFCEPLSACPLLSLGGGMKLLRGELKWAFAGRSTLNRTGMVHLERQSGSEGTKRTREHLCGGCRGSHRKLPSGSIPESGSWRFYISSGINLAE